MKQPTKPHALFIKRFFSLTPYRFISALSGEDIRSTNTSKPKGWDAAKPYGSIPGPKKLPFFGNTWRFFPLIGEFYGCDSLEINKLLFEKYGKIAKLDGLPFRDNIIVSDADAIESIFRNEGIYPFRDALNKSFGYYRRYVRPDLFGGSYGLAESQGKEWHNLRSIINPIMMHPQTIFQYVNSLNVITEELLQIMRKVANSNPLKEMNSNFNMTVYCWTLEAIMFVCLDKRLGCLNDNLSEDSEQSKIIAAVIDIFTLFSIIEKSPTVRNVYKTKSWKSFVTALNFLTETFIKYIDESVDKLENQKNTNNETKTILQHLLKIDKKFCLATVVDILTGGVDTTQKIATSSLYYLAKFPKAQETLREELYKLLPNKDSPITKETILKSSYLRAVVKETTRLAPIASYNTRHTVKDMVLCGYQVPKGTKVSTSNLLLSVSDDNYIHAEKFIPERWLRSSTKEISAKSANPFITLPFGTGPRSCIGQRLATLELEILIAKIIRNFYLEWHYKDATFRFSPFYGVVDPLKLRVLEVEK